MSSKLMISLFRTSSDYDLDGLLALVQSMDEIEELEREIYDHGIEQKRRHLVETLQPLYLPGELVRLVAIGAGVGAGVLGLTRRSRCTAAARCRAGRFKAGGRRDTPTPTAATSKTTTTASRRPASGSLRKTFSIGRLPFKRGLDHRFLSCIASSPASANGYRRGGRSAPGALRRSRARCPSHKACSSCRGV